MELSTHSPWWVRGKEGALRARIPELMGEIGRMGLLCLREEGAGGAVS